MTSATAFLTARVARNFATKCRQFGQRSMMIQMPIMQQLANSGRSQGFLPLRQATMAFTTNTLPLMFQAQTADEASSTHTNTSKEDIMNHLESQGLNIEDIEVLEKNGRPMGSSVVTFASDEDAESAIANLHETEFHGRRLFVRPFYGHNNADESTLYVGNLNFESTWYSLKDHLTSTGLSVEYVKVLTRPSGQSKGAAYVKFSSAEMAEKAIHDFNETEFENRNIYLRSKNPGAQVHQEHDPEADQNLQKTIFIGNLCPSMEVSDIHSLLEPYGRVSYCRVIQPKEEEDYAFSITKLSSVDSALQAIDELHESEFNGRTIQVRPKLAKK